MMEEVTPQTIRQTLIDIINTISPDLDLSSLKDDVPLRDQLELDSMDFMDIVMELRKNHKINVPKEDYSQLATITSAIAYLTQKFQSYSATQPSQ